MDVQVVIAGEQLDALVKAGAVTLDPKEAEECCGIERDAAGRCLNRPHHPIYVKILHMQVG